MIIYIEREAIKNNLSNIILNKKMIIQLKDYFGEEYAIDLSFFSNHILNFILIYTLISFLSLYIGNSVIILYPFVTLSMIQFWKRETSKLCSNFGLYHNDNNNNIINNLIDGK